MTRLYTSRQLLHHDTGRHVESSHRLERILERLRAHGVPDRCVMPDFSPVEPDELTRLHALPVVEAVRQLAQAGGGRLDPDTVVSPSSDDAARLAAGAAIAATDAVLAGQDRNALCLIRPPGHHATPTRSMGFCLFNNVALAARRALDHHQLARILVVDFDVHHGNGTQDCFYDDGQVTFLSVHRYGWGFYPGTGAAAETGTGRGLGHTINAPVPADARRSAYHEVYERALEKARTVSRPELVLISAGFDAHRDDPIGSLGLETEDFITLTRRIIDVAETYCDGRIVSCLEGGYDLNALAESVEVHLEELLKASSPE